MLGFGTSEDFSPEAAVFRQFESLATAIIQGQSRFGGQETTEILIITITYSVLRCSLLLVHSSLL